MSTPSKQRRNPVTCKSVDPVRVFLAMAYDLKVSTNKLVIDAHADLSAGRYISFLRKLDDMTSQTYTSCADERFGLHQLAALFSKYPFKEPGIDRTSVAMSKFQKAEHRCKRMNQKLRLRRSKIEPPHMQFMREFIERTIGAFVPYNTIFDKCDFGPGSSVGVHGSNTSFVEKLRTLTCTPSALPVALQALSHNVHYASILTRGAIFSYDGNLSIKPDSGDSASGVELVTVQYNKITCVPKNAKTDRTIAIEPTLNGFLQKGVDIYLRGRLRRVGVDLKTQALNQSLARLGSRDGSYATIDLSAASDSISIQLVKELLPPDWFAFLDTIRSPSYKFNDSEPIRYEKFCSMGNGFCFPLETLIFKAAVEYVMSVTQYHPNRASAVYGDDIIVPHECALLLIEVLRDLGFTPNTDKTFVLGGFKESCGADYFFGVNVRPVYIKDKLYLNHTCYPLLNELRKRKLLHTWKVIFDQLPGRQRFLRPYDREDDSAITVDLDVFMSSRHARFDRLLHTWTWKKVVTRNDIGIPPSGPEELLAGKLRGDLKHQEVFASRFNESTRIQMGI